MCWVNKENIKIIYVNTYWCFWSFLDSFFDLNLHIITVCLSTFFFLFFLTITGCLVCLVGGMPLPGIQWRSHRRGTLSANKEQRGEEKPRLLRKKGGRKREWQKHSKPTHNRKKNSHDYLRGQSNVGWRVGLQYTQYGLWLQSKVLKWNFSQNAT